MASLMPDQMPHSMHAVTEHQHGRDREACPRCVNLPTMYRYMLGHRKAPLPYAECHMITAMRHRQGQLADSPQLQQQ